MGQQTSGRHYSQGVAQGGIIKTYKNGSKDHGVTGCAVTKGRVGSTDQFPGKSQAVQSCAPTAQPVPSLLHTGLGRSSYGLPGTGTPRSWPPLCPVRRPVPFPLLLPTCWEV